MKTYSVTLPIGGHIRVDVEAASEAEAIETASMMDFKTSDIDEWEILEEVSRGNVLYFPRPWSAEAECVEE